MVPRGVYYTGDRAVVEGKRHKHTIELGISECSLSKSLPIFNDLHTSLTPATLRPAMNPTIGVIIVSYNTRELLRTCLESLRSCGLPLCVVVVDSASTDGSAEMVRAAFPE